MTKNFIQWIEGYFHHPKRNPTGVGISQDPQSLPVDTDAAGDSGSGRNDTVVIINKTKNRFKQLYSIAGDIIHKASITEEDISVATFINALASVIKSLTKLQDL